MTSPQSRFILFFTCLLLIVVNGRHTDSSSEEFEQHETKPIIVNLKLVKEFVRLVDGLNLNLSIIGTYREYSEERGPDNVLSVKWHMPLNVETTTNPTFHKINQKHFLHSVKKFPKKAAKARAIVIENGKEKTVNEYIVNSENIIDLPSYDHLIRNVNGEVKLEIPSNKSCITAFNYFVSNSSNDGEKNVQILESTVWVNEVDISKDFPTDVLKEIKKLLPKLYWSINDFSLFARLLSIKLTNIFETNFDVLVDVQNVAFGTKPFAKLDVGTTNVLVIAQ